MASNQLSAIVHRTKKTQSVLLTTLTLSTCFRTVHFRSTPLYLPDAFTDTFSLNVQHHDFWTQHLRVVYKPSLNRVCGRPATIFYTALKRTINYIPFVTHCLDAKETKNQGQPAFAGRQARSLPDCITQAGLRAFVRPSHRYTTLFLTDLQCFKIFSASVFFD